MALFNVVLSVYVTVYLTELPGCIGWYNRLGHRATGVVPKLGLERNGSYLP